MSLEKPKLAEVVIPAWMAKLLDQVREAEQEEGTFEIEAEDELPFAQLGSWVALSGVSPRAMALYWFMAMHLNLKRGDRYVWPSKDALAYLMQYSRGDKIDPFLKELVAIGAVIVVSVPDSSGPQRRNVYRLRRNPPPGYAAGPLTLGEFYATLGPVLEAERTTSAAARAVKSNKTAGQDVSPETGGQCGAVDGQGDTNVNSNETAGQSVYPETGGDVTPEIGVHVTPETGGVTTATTNNTNDAAPVGRVSAPDARRASTGSSARAKRSGSAAPRKTSAARMDRSTAAAFRSVVDALPADLRQLAERPLPVKVPVRPLGDLIREQLCERTPGQLAERIARRWIQHRWEEKCHSAMAGEPLRSGVGIAVELLKAPECSHPRCEDGTDIDTKAPCRVCPERRENFRRSKRSGGGAIPPQAGGQGAGPVKWWCVTDGCGYNSYGSGPADGLCGDCRAEGDLDLEEIDPAEAEAARLAFAALFGSAVR
ncbi:hypothetical protein GCM10010495_74230 [Kitasatospora herbaricolor]|uniref:hypothetical protein n=1 Tax=Kitasatospora herbaricolor TaxID=68217 RepID=UPI0017498DD5|nr:hypothetical protein [Kitasatospora herbaricolor]MDQ0305475.1 hypothetical protein [Kitasatospora herbaricolor]GGV45767.1 hypothetical protein GCM10010495_74230 [Kitasatospora herbaricolor]